MRPRRKSPAHRAGAAGILIALVLSGPPTALAAPGHPCGERAAARLERLGLGFADLDAVSWTEQRAGRGHNGPVTSYEMWARVRACSGGHLAMGLTGTCHILTVYTRGDCRIEGVDAY